MTPLRRDFRRQAPKGASSVAHDRCERSGRLAVVTPCSDENALWFVSTVTISRVRCDGSQIRTRDVAAHSCGRWVNQNALCLTM